MPHTARSARGLCSLQSSGNQAGTLPPNMFPQSVRQKERLWPLTHGLLKLLPGTDIHHTRSYSFDQSQLKVASRVREVYPQHGTQGGCGMGVGGSNLKINGTQHNDYQNLTGNFSQLRQNIFLNWNNFHKGLSIN